MSVVGTIKPALDAVRAIGGTQAFLVHTWTATIRVRTWTGERPGIGTFTDVDTQLFNASVTGELAPVRVKQLTTKDIISSGDLYRDRDMRIGPITPDFAASYLPAGGYTDSTIETDVTTSAVEVFWNISGRGMPTGGEWCSKVSEDVSELHYYVVVRATGKQP